MATKFQPARSDQAGFNIKELFFKYLRFLPLFILSLIFTLAVSFIYLRYSIPIYRSSGQIILKDDRRSTSGDDKFSELFLDDRGKNIQNEIEYLKSTPLMARVVEALNLNFIYYAKGKIKQQNVYKDSPFYVEALSMPDSSTFSWDIIFKSNGSFTINGDGPYLFGQVFKTPNGAFKLVRSAGKINGHYNVVWRPTGTLASAFASNLAVAPKTGGSILLITLEADHPQVAADVINQLMVEYQEATIEDKNATTSQTLRFIDGRLKVVSHELDSVTNVLLNYMRNNQINDVSTAASDYLVKANDIDEKMNVESYNLSELQLIENYLRNSGKNVIVPSSLGITDATLATLVANYNMLQRELKGLSNDGAPENNPRVKEKEEAIEQARRNILENIRNLRNVTNFSLSRLQSQSRSIKGQLGVLPAKQQTYIEIKRQQDNKLAIYNFLMSKREESAIAYAATISNIKVLEKAGISWNPVKPDAGKTRMLAIIIGLVIPALFVLIMELLDDKVTTRTDIEKVTSATILGEVGHSSSADTLLVTTKNRSFLAEQFRILRSNLQYVLRNTPHPVLLVTSSFSGEGKSFISTNLGAVMALAGKKTVILEFDIRKPKILTGLHLPPKPGITNFLIGDMKPEEIIIKLDQYDNLYVVPCGPIPPNPSELLLDTKLHDFFSYLKANFDMIVMDTAPVGMVSDGLSLSQFADATIYIVRHGVTHKKQIELLNEFHVEEKLPKVNVILNDIKLRAGYGYYGGRYGYGYGYGYGGSDGSGYYDDDHSRQSIFARWFNLNGHSKKATKKKKV